MPAEERLASAPGAVPRRRAIGRLIPVIVIVALAALVLFMGWHRYLSLESLVRHREQIDGFIAVHTAAAVAAFFVLYVAVVALSIPGAVFLTIAGGLLFGTVIAGVVVVVAATAGAAIIFIIARSAFGDHLVRRAGPLAAKLSHGFRADAFNYLLFLRLVPAFPFWLVNLVPALAGVRLATFVAATALGIIPATFAFAFFGAGLDSVIAAQASAYQACVAAGQAGCRLEFNAAAAVTPELLGALIVLGLVSLVPVLVKRFRGRGRKADAAIREGE
jgi:uncharacterized membrane protein YdjX (TVP38/TMEM64 family)